MPIGPSGESLPYPGDPGYMGNGRDIGPMVGQNGLPGGPQFDPSAGQVGAGGQQERLNQLLEARQMIDQEIAAIVGIPSGTENLDMLPPPPIDPMMAPDPMMAQGGMPTGAVPGTVPGMASPGLLGGQYA